LFIIFISIFEFRRSDNILLLQFKFCSVFFKIFFFKFKKFGFKLLTLIFSFLIFIYVSGDDVHFFYEKSQKIISGYFGWDLIRYFEYLSFSSISFPAKFFGKNTSEIYITNILFIEEEFIKNLLKYIIKFRIGIFDN